MITTSMSETATNIVIRIIDDSNGVFTDETGRSKEEILNLLKHNQIQKMLESSNNLAFVTSIFPLIEFLQEHALTLKKVEKFPGMI